MNELLGKKCVPCEGIGSAFTPEQAQQYLNKVEGWKLNGKIIEKTFKFRDFVQAMDFANRITEIAESENHHPDLHVSWGIVKVDLWTHALDGLTENDFIIAAKIDELQ